MPLTRPPATASFLSSPVVTDLGGLEADFAVIGIPHGVPYDPGAPATAAVQAPRAVRERSARYGAFREHHDFDSGGPMLPRDVRVVDVGDAVTPPGERPGRDAVATRAVAALLARGAVPVVLGGDDSTPPFALAAYEGHGPVTVVQVDAHIDYRDEVRGAAHGARVAPCAAPPRCRGSRGSCTWAPGASAAPEARSSRPRSRAATPW